MANALWRALRALVYPSVPSSPVAPSRAEPAPTADAPPAAPGESDIPPCPTSRIEKLLACPVCGAERCFPVTPFNKLILSPHPPDERSYHYKYGLCRDCGVVYARRRPVGPRYAWMIEHFEETLGRAEFGQRLSGKLVLSSYPLGEEERVELAARASKGVFVSDHAGLSRKAFLPGLLSDRLSNSVHVEMLGSLLPMHAPRVLEIRSRLGSISAGLQRLYGATPQAMALFPNQQFLIQEVYGIPATSGIDYDNFTVPFDGTFDLIIANHMLTHALHPREMLATLHGRLTPGGHLYLFNEPDDREFLTSGKSLFNTMNPFHMQAFDGPSLVRTLEANGFAPTFVTTHNGSHVCLAQKREYTDTWTRMPDGLSSRRRRAYRNAQDRAALMMPVFARPRLGEPWDAVAARAVESGVAEVTAKGVVKLRRSEPA